MITGVFDNISITGVASALPIQKVINSDYVDIFGEATVKKLIDSTGVQERYQSGRKQTASDLAYIAARHLIEEKSIDPHSIGILIFLAAHVDYITPATAFVLQERLGLSQDCIPLDINLSCSAFIYGLYIASSLLNAGNTRKALILIGDTTTKTVSSEDTSGLLFGDGGAAVLLEKNNSGGTICIGIKSDGSRFKSIIIPNGAARNPDISAELVLCEDGIRRSRANLHMNGMDVFNFAMTDVPALFKEFINYFDVNIEDIDALVMHQPNQFIMKHLAKKIKIPMEKVPLSLDKYGNTSGASIPVTLCKTYGESNNRVLKLMFSGFGVGLSWGVATLTLNTNSILPIIHSDDFYTDKYEG